MTGPAYVDELIEQARGERKTVLAKVRQLGAVRAALPLLTGLVQRAPYPDLRTAAVESLGSFHSGETEEILVVVLKEDKSWHVRNAALKVLARRATPGAIAALREATKDKAYGVREDAKLLLEQFRGKKGKP